MGACFSFIANKHPFPLLALPLHLQEKIIAKINFENYLLIQQTCKHILELVERSPYINNYVGDSYQISYRKNLDGSYGPYTFQWFEKSPFGPIYGVRYAMLGIAGELLKPLVQPICDFLKEHRITSRGLLIPHLLDDITKEDCAALFKVLKLKQLYFPIDDTDRFEAIFELKNLEKLELQMEPNRGEVIPLITRFLPIVQSFTLRVDPIKFRPAQIFELFVAVMKLLDSEMFPNVLDLEIVCKGSSIPAASEDYPVEIFQDFNPTPAVSKTTTIIGFKCSLGKTQSPCTIFWGPEFLKIRYDRSCNLLTETKLIPNKENKRRWSFKLPDLFL